MEIRIINQAGAKYLSFPPNTQFILSSRSVTDVIGECFGTGIMSVLAEEEHLAEDFFKLESLEAGEILQKFRTYGIRLAIVVSPKRLHAGRFKEMASEEKKGCWFSVFTEKRKAVEWLL